ncbi:hypothetical protein [Streptomyces sp. WMMB303]|uniref:hypothetical protein n=1 Tax=Streptomyces sp. WMMB303 TaxID=3034154 RepID=UPI0023EC2F7C|nr:hypothetical protein [Streptomyces sp. WMMB303]MDF4254623.1 hypothetical protein [Streptomyces sp. WMMB303]
MTPTQRSWRLAGQFAAAALALVVVWQLTFYPLPSWLLVLTALASSVGLMEAGQRITDAVHTRTYRCPDPACAHRVTLINCLADEHRREQENAAAHPYYH